MKPLLAFLLVIVFGVTCVAADSDRCSLSLPPVARAAVREESTDTATLAAKDAEAEPQNKVLWKRLAVLAIEKYLQQPGREEQAALVGKRLESPGEYMQVVDANETARAVEHLRDFAKIQNAPFPTVDPNRVVVVYLVGPAGGAWQIGVIFDQDEAATRAVVFVPGK